MNSDRSALVLAVATEGFWEWDLQTDRAYLSPRYCELVGYSPDDTIFDSHFFRSIIHPDDRDHVFQTMASHLRGELDLSVIEYRMISRDGTMRWIEGRGKIVAYDEHGTPRRMVGTIVDISDRKHAEELLRLSERKYSTVFHTSPDAIILTRRSDCRYLEVNEGFAQITGYPVATAIGNSSLGLNLWVDPSERQRLVEELDAHGLVREVVSRFRRKDGSILFGQLSGCTIEIDGEPCLLSVVRDVTEHYQAVQAIRENEENLRTMMDAIPVGILVCDDQSIEYLNSTFTKNFGYLLQDIPTLESWFLQAYPAPEYRDSLVSAWRFALDESRRTGVPVPAMEAIVACKDGTILHTLGNTQIFMDRVLVIFTDITDHDMLQEELLKVQELESLGVLAGGIAHDFNNILTGIMGNISFARMLCEWSEDAAPALDRAEQASLRAADLAKQLLVFARGGHPVKREIDLEKVVAEAASLVLSGSAVKAVLDIVEPLHAVEADEGQINQSLRNIVINALQAMPGGGKLTLRGQNVSLGARNCLGLAAGSYVEISISDEGCGIPKENLKKIFDPYFTTKPGGTGLGLATTYAIIAKHNGRVSVASSAGHGTTFSIHLPSTGKAGARPEMEREVNTGQHVGGAILVMDDEELVRELAARALANAGYTVQTCENGEDAVHLYQKAKERGTPFALAVMDLTVPGGMGGVEAARGILSFDPDALLIVSSGYFADPVMSEFRSYGFSGAIAKPYRAEDLLQAIGKVPCLRGAEDA